MMRSYSCAQFCGAFYLVWLGVRTFREAGDLPARQEATAAPGVRCEAFSWRLSIQDARVLLAFIRSSSIPLQPIQLRSSRSG
jgi:threonine/homoserine/homoserine lactone efflux protein